MNPKHSSLLFLLLLLFVTAASPVTGQGEKPHYKLGLISGAKDQKHQSEKERKINTEVLNAATDAFAAARRFNLIERDQLSAVLTEKSLQDFIGGQVNNKLSDVLGLDLVGVVGHTVEATKSLQGADQMEWVIDVRLIDVKTASLLTTITSKRASLKSLLPPATPREAGTLLADSIREAFPPLGYVIKVDGKEITVDLGTEVGLKDGDTLEVVQEGEQIIHPVTGEVLASPLKVVAELKVTSASLQVAICKRKSGSEVQLRGIVRLKGTQSKIIDWFQKFQKLPFVKKKD